MHAIAFSADEALQCAESFAPNLILMDIRLKGSHDGIEAAKRVREKFAIPVIFVTAHADSETLDRAKKAAPFGYVVKPFGASQMDELDFESYTETLVTELMRSYSTKAGKITSRVKACHVCLEIDQAIPCGLILNELLTNALKYAFPTRAKARASSTSH